MPFDPDKPPSKVKGLSEKKQRQWTEVFNSCWKEHHSDSKCHAMAWGVVKKEGSMNDKAVAAELVRVAADIGPVEPKLAMSLLQEAKAVKLKALAVEFFQSVKDFRGALNGFIGEMTGAVRNPQALRGFPELKDVLELNAQLRKGVLRHTFLTERDLAERMTQVVELDA